MTGLHRYIGEGQFLYTQFAKISEIDFLREIPYDLSVVKRLTCGYSKYCRTRPISLSACGAFSSWSISCRSRKWIAHQEIFYQKQILTGAADGF
jgi:hypothetical protein